MRLDRPYVLVLDTDLRGNPLQPRRLPVRDAAVLAKAHACDAVSRVQPRTSRSSPSGYRIELRYVDPRPAAPWYIAAASQEVPGDWHVTRFGAVRDSSRDAVRAEVRDPSRTAFPDRYSGRRRFY